MASPATTFRNTSLLNPRLSFINRYIRISLINPYISSYLIKPLYKIPDFQVINLPSPPAKNYVKIELIVQIYVDVRAFDLNLKIFFGHPETLRERYVRPYGRPYASTPNTY